MKNSTIREVEKLEAAMEANPPVIVWRTNRKGIQVAVEIRDPHVERSIEAQAEPLRASATHIERDLIEEEAREVAERFRRYRADNTPLLAAARIEI